MRVLLLGLTSHPDTPCGAVERIEVRVERTSAGDLALAYGVQGDLQALRIPEPAAPVFTDRLWRHTCFEAFVRNATGAYSEFNFSPSGAFAAYRFGAYRARMTRIDAPVRVLARTSAGRLDLAATIPAGAEGCLGLSCVLEAHSGELSYWALRHPPGKPDFHHPEAFAVSLDEIRH